MSGFARRTVAGVAAALLAVVAVAGPAHAHATLQTTAPGDGARLAAPPDTVSLTFTEPVSAPLGAVQVVGPEGARVDSGDVRQSGATVAVALDGGRGDGAYVVTYRVISADGHPIRGAFTFTVGDGPGAADTEVAAQLDEAGDRTWEVAGAVARWLAYLGALLAAGGAVHLALVDVRPGTRLAQGRLLGVAAGAALLGVLATLPVQAHLATGLGITSLLRPGVAGAVLAEGVGLSAVVVFAGLAAVTVGLGPTRTALARPVLLAGAAVTVAGFALTGHTTTTDPRWLATGADVVHLAAAAVWFGGLVLLARSVWGRGSADPETAGHLVARFSAVATVAVLAVGGAGVALGWSEVRTLDGLTGTTYGRLLLAKVAVVALIGAAGLYNRARLVPAIARATRDRTPTGAWGVLRRTVRFEVVAMVAALALTAVLVNVTPARAVERGPASTTVPLGDGSVNIVVDPATAGRNQLHLYLLDGKGRPADLAPEGLSVELALPAAGIGPVVREPDVIGPGHLLLDGAELTAPGAWEVTVVVRASRFEQHTATAVLPVRP